MRTITINTSDSTAIVTCSLDHHGERTWQGDAPWGVFQSLGYFDEETPLSEVLEALQEEISLAAAVDGEDTDCDGEDIATVAARAIIADAPDAAPVSVPAAAPALPPQLSSKERRIFRRVLRTAAKGYCPDGTDELRAALKMRRDAFDRAVTDLGRRGYVQAIDGTLQPDDDILDRLEDETPAELFAELS